MTRDARAGSVGAVFGLVFVLVNAGDLAAPADLLVRAVGVVVFVGVMVALVRRGGTRELPAVDPAGWRMYTVGVVFEVVALAVGLFLINRSGHEELAVPWVVVIVGLHFLPLARAFHASFFTALAGVLVVLGVAAGLMALGGADRWAVSLVSGVCAGFVLLVTALRPAVAQRP